MADKKTSSFSEAIKLELQVADLKQKLADAQAYARRLEKEKWQLLRAIDEVLTPSMVDLACQYVGELKQSLVNAQARCRELQAVVDSLPRTQREGRLGR